MISVDASVDPTPRQASDSDLELALAAWSRAIGDQNVDESTGTCRRYGRSTSPWRQEPIAVLRPASVAEVQEIVRIAGAYRVPLYPISGGKNWGLGDACPTTAGQVLLDLRRLNAIREVNAELRYAVIEAGVTQRQLFDYLAANEPTLAFDATGAGPNATIVGNIMERGFGHSPYGDRFHNSCNYEVVLADGRLLKTGFGHYSNAKTAHLLKPGLGPSLDGLFTQSNLGIVTAMTVWLMSKSDCLEAFAFKVNDESALTDIIDALRPLRLSGVLPSTVHIANDLRIISSKMTYPWDRAGGVAPLPGSVREQLRKEYGIGAWNVLGGLHGTPEIVHGARRALKRALRGLATPRFINYRRLHFAKKLARVGQRMGLAKAFSKQLNSINSAFALLNGEPVADHLRGSAWRSRVSATNKATEDPLERGDGLIWLSPTLPMTGCDAVRVEEIANDVCRRFEFDLLLTFVSINGRAMCCPISISFDNNSTEECRRAADCYDALVATMCQYGYLPYRLGIQSMPLTPCQSEIHWDLVREIKEQLDSKGILAPGRYDGT
jgi:4-cresol dehydrogenase (hydroxylating)